MQMSHARPEPRPGSIKFDFERVVWDPEYRRRVMAELKRRAEAQRRVTFAFPGRGSA